MECPDPESFAAMLDEQASAVSREELVRHISGCEPCRSAVALMFAEGTPTDGGPAARPPEQFRYGRYEIVEVLGSGGMGVVYRAKDPELDRTVALKVLRQGIADERLKREAQGLARLEHPNVVTVYDVGREEEAFIAMQYVDGDNFRTWLKQPRTTDEILGVLRDAARGVAAAHAADLIHRDLKPDNVFISRNGQVLVGDFGLVRGVPNSDASSPAAVDTPLGMELTRGTLLGTPAYMAPEQATAGTTSIASDQFSFCVMAWEALVGTRPFKGATLEELAQNAQQGAIVEPAPDRKLPRWLDATLRKGLDAEPSRRFASMAELGEALTPRPRRWPTFVAAAVVMLAAVLGVAAMRNRSSVPEPIPCGGEAQMLDDAWTSNGGNQSASAFGWASRLDRLRSSWIEKRAATCKAQESKGRAYFEQRIPCFDRVRRDLRAAASVLKAHPDRLGDLDTVRFIDKLPVERCSRDYLVAAPPPTAAQLPRVRELEEQLVGLELVSEPSDVVRDANALLDRAEQVGYAPLIGEIALRSATLAYDASDYGAAERTARRALQVSEQLVDHISRTEASAALAKIMARRSSVDAATTFRDNARNALVATQGDPRAELAVLDAEIAVDLLTKSPELLADQQKLVARSRAFYGQSAMLLDPLLGLADAYGADPLATAVREELFSILSNAATANVEAQLANLINQRDLAVQRADTSAIIAFDRLTEAVFVAEAPDAPGTFYAIKTHAMDLEIVDRMAEALQAYERAIAQYDRTHMDEPSERLELVQNVAAAQLELGDPNACLRTLETAIGPTVPEATADGIRVLQGRALVALNRYREAIEVLEGPLIRTRGTPRTTRLAYISWSMARALYDSGQRPRAIDLARDAVDAFARSIEQFRANRLLAVQVRRFELRRDEVQKWLTTANAH